MSTGTGSVQCGKDDFPFEGPLCDNHSSAHQHLQGVALDVHVSSRVGPTGPARAQAADCAVSGYASCVPSLC